MCTRVASGSPFVILYDVPYDFFEEPCYDVTPLYFNRQSTQKISDGFSRPDVGISL